MANFTQSIRKVFANAGKSFVTFPAVMANGLLFTLVALIRASLDWQAQLPWQFLFSCLQASFAVGAVFSLAALTFAHSRKNTKNAFAAANGLGLMVPAAAFLLLYFFGAQDPVLSGGSGLILSSLASARSAVAALLSLLAFLLLASRSEEKTDFSGALFMALKAFFLALIYGLVILAGVSGVFAAVKTLLYPGLSDKVFSYTSIISGFLGFSIFVGYFPDFRRGAKDEHREAAQKQPRFITILFEYILVPIMLALTLVLILWALRTMIGGMNTRFVSLYGIATAYAVGGLLLHILITDNVSPAARFYRRIFPFAALFILFFEAWALILQLSRFGMKTVEYFFILVWIAALVSAVLLILKKEKAHPGIVYITSAVAILAVLPYLGFTDLPFISQVNRLEGLLSAQGMLQEDRIVPAQTEPDQRTREGITDAAEFLAFTDTARYPAWFDKDQLEGSGFSRTMGFERIYPDQDPRGQEEYRYTMLTLAPQIIDIRGYQWELPYSGSIEKTSGPARFTGQQGEYEIRFADADPGQAPRLEILLNGRSIIMADLKAYLDEIQANYPDTQGSASSAALEDMTYKAEAEEISLTMVFNRVEVNTSLTTGEQFYSVGIHAVYLNEK